MPTLYVAFELGGSSWKLAATTGPGQPPRLRTVPARSLTRTFDERARAKARFQYARRFAHGGSRRRRIGIVAVARKLLTAFEQYLRTGTPPAGAEVDLEGHSPSGDGEASVHAARGA